MGKTVSLKQKQSREDKIFLVINYIFATGFLLAVLYPVLFVLSASFSAADRVVAGHVWLWPVEPGLEGYKAVFKTDSVWVGYANSMFYAVVGTTINVVLTVMAAYPLARKDFFGRNFFMFLFAFTMMFRGGIIPTYLVVKSVGIMNTRWAMILPTALTVWNVIITRTYFQANIPDELLEAAQLDGCSDLYFIRKIVIPLSGPIVAVIALFYAVIHWNAFFPALLYLNDAKLFPLQMVLREILIQSQVQTDMIGDIESLDEQLYLAELLKYSLIVVASLPVMLLYPFVQKYFVRGVMIGALKG
jgi:multiple sugar transport system permease protein/putative aldouronate transport system permease protein